MSDTPSTPDVPLNNGNGDNVSANGGERSPTVRVLAQYAKDLSFENPGALAPAGAGAPEIELGIDVRVEPGPRAENLFAVDLRMSAKAKRGADVVFIIELVYTGIVQIQDARPQDIEPILLVDCPRLLFPFARRIVAEMTREGGHPPLFVDPIDFVGLYRQQKLQAAQQADDASK